MAFFPAARYSLPRLAETENDRWVAMRNGMTMSWAYVTGQEYAGQATDTQESDSACRRPGQFDGIFGLGKTLLAMVNLAVGVSVRRS